MTTSSTLREVPGEGTIEVRRSARRRRTVSMVRENGRLVLMIPGRLSRSEEDWWIERMVANIRAKEKKRQVSSADLAQRAEELAPKYLPDRVRPTSVRWVGNMTSRWGSCTPLDGSIRISDALKGVPLWVLDYVLVHELAHLMVAGHDERFWAIVNQYPKTERARGFLAGMEFAGGRQPSE